MIEGGENHTGNNASAPIDGATTPIDGASAMTCMAPEARLAGLLLGTIDGRPLPQKGVQGTVQRSKAVGVPHRLEFLDSKGSKHVITWQAT